MLIRSLSNTVPNIVSIIEVRRFHIAFYSRHCHHRVLKTWWYWERRLCVVCVAHSSALLNWRLLLSNDLLLKVAHRVAFLVVSLGVLVWHARTVCCVGWWRLVVQIRWWLVLVLVMMVVNTRRRTDDRRSVESRFLPAILTYWSRRLMKARQNHSKRTEFVWPSSTRPLSQTRNSARRPDRFSQKEQNSSVRCQPVHFSSRHFKFVLTTFLPANFGSTQEPLQPCRNIE